MPQDGLQDGLRFPQPPPGTLSPAEEAIVADVANAIRGSTLGTDCILFLGAGVHAAPQSPCTIADLLSRLSPEAYAAAARAAERQLGADAATVPEEEYRRATLEAALLRDYPPDARPMLGVDLSLKLAGLGEPKFADVFKNDSPRNLGRVSLYYELGGSRKGRNALVSEIEKAVQANKRPSPILRAIAQLPFNLFITTNYDGLLERALDSERRYPRVNIYDKKGERSMQDWKKTITADQPYLLKLHGDIRQPESIVVTDEDYIQFVLRMSDKPPMNPVPEGLRAQLKDNSVLFIGYSLMDYNLRLLFKTIRWNMDPADIKTSFSVDPFPNELVVRVMSDPEQVRFIAQDAWMIVPRVYEQVTGKRFQLTAS